MSGPRVLVTGASGFIGSHLVRFLEEGGLAVRSAVRTGSTNGDFVAIGDIDGGTDWQSALHGVDSVVHLAARVHVLDDTARDSLAAFWRTNVEGTQRLAEMAVQSGVRRLVFVSSLAVIGRHEGAVNEETPCQGATAYARSKLEAERALLAIARESKLEVVILRPPLVYGPDAPGNFSRLERLLARGIPLPLGAAHNRRSFMYVGNLCALIMICLSSPAAANQVFVAADREPVSTAQFVRLLGAAMGRSPRLFTVPPAILRVAGRLLGRLDDVERLFGTLVVDDSKARERLAWNPPHDITAALAASQNRS